MNEKRVLAALSFETAWERQVLTGVIAYARENNLQWEIRAVARETDPKELLQKFNPHALLYHPHMPLPPDLSPELKIVCFDWKETTRRPLMQIDDHQVGRLAAEHFLSHGATDFCFAGSLSSSYSRMRFEGFRKKLKSAGYEPLAFDTKGTFLGLLNNRESPEILENFTATLEQLKKPLAIFAADDFVAYTVFETCLKNGWSVPDEIRILGVNNDELVCHACDPMLSSIRIPYQQMGYKAGEWISRLLSGKSTPSRPLSFSPLEVIERRATKPTRVDDPIVKQSLEFIRDHLHENISTADLLKLTGASRAKLERHFKQAINRTPYFEILHQRIEHAKQLLRDTEISVQDLAQQCGFNSTTRFCQAFREKTEMTPSTYRIACQ